MGHRSKSLVPQLTATTTATATHNLITQDVIPTIN